MRLFRLEAGCVPASILFVTIVALPCVGKAQYIAEVLHSPAVPSPRSFGWGAGGGQQVGHTNIFLGGPSHALLWNGSAGSFVDLHPAGFGGSYAFDAADGKQVGWREVYSPVAHVYATMWSGSAVGWTDLHNEKYSDTRATGIGGGRQVGFGTRSSNPAHFEAIMWSGTAASAVGLHPGSAYDRSLANDTDGAQQVGYARIPAKLNPHAALWSGTAASFVDLNPAGYEQSEAFGVANGEQVGFVGTTIAQAALWNGTPESFILLNPGPGWGSQAFATNGVFQVGAAASETGTAFQTHAALWSGTAGSYFDLHNLLPSQFIGTGAESRAMGIDEFGNIVGWAADLDDGGRAKAVLWRPVPEPASGIATAGLMALLACRRRFNAAREKS